MPALSVPNLLSGSRLALAPILPVLAWRGEVGWFLGCLSYALLSDAVDGWLARKLHQTSEIGTQLDSWGDLALCCCVPPGVWLLWPDLIRAEAIFVGMILIGYTIPTVFALVKYHRVPSYHTRMAKIAAVAVGLGLFSLIAGGPAWLFRVSAIFVIVEAIEEIAITAVLPMWISNVAGFGRAMRIRKGEA